MNEPFYKGRALYLGPDAPMDGLYHGKHYLIETTEMASGRVRVSVEGYVYDVKIVKLTYANRNEFNLDFLRKPEKSKKRRKADV